MVVKERIAACRSTTPSTVEFPLHRHFHPEPHPRLLGEPLSVEFMKIVLIILTVLITSTSFASEQRICSGSKAEKIKDLDTVNTFLVQFPCSAEAAEYLTSMKKLCADCADIMADLIASESPAEKRVDVEDLRLMASDPRIGRLLEAKAYYRQSLWAMTKQTDAEKKNKRRSDDAKVKIAKVKAVLRH